MFEDWIKPFDSEDLSGFFMPSGSLGQQCVFNVPQNDESPVLALIGADAKWARRVRRCLYRFASRPLKCRVADLGDFRDMQADTVISAMQAVNGEHLTPVIIGARPDMTMQILHTLNAERQVRFPVFVHESVPGWTANIPEGSHLEVLGVQQHLLFPDSLKHAKSGGIAYFRLGQIREDISRVEPIARDADLFCCDLSALRYPDLPAQSSRSTSGLFTEEACQIMRYAGMGTHVRAFILSGHDPMSVDHEQSANTAAQLIWYLIDGFDQRISEFPGRENHFLRYTVHLQQYAYDLAFHKSEKSGRWWVEIPSGESNLLFSCAYEDYQDACDNVLSERIFRCMDAS